MVDYRTHTDRIKLKAHQMGFSHIGIARAGKLEEEGRHLQEWLHRQYNADMTWMENNIDRRTDPRTIVDGAQSVVVVAFNYYTDERLNESRQKGKISRYAWGDDYHEILTPKVRELQQFIDSFDGSVRSRSYVDTGPVMEKAWAARAGIGWIGKHTNLITTDYGSWVFLGTIITTLKLEYDAPISDFCGTCTACIDACPTDAIIEPYVLDANKCIPYLTIECKDEEIPATDEMNFENWVFGCDICQDVCPWNRFQNDSADARFAPREFAKALDLETILELDDNSFREIFRKSPVKRAKLSGLQRNARIVRKQNESNNQ